MVTALYRRYRPENFAEMIGQSQVTDPLMTALRTNRVNHAYLFSGPRGCGKTTSARILARCLNCAEGPTDTPCGVCPSCVELGRDGPGSLDVVEIDAASHNGVDDARDLRERAVFAPARDRFKIFILDEAHMVTPQGFNALLKIVEEPPEHIKFIFATTEPDKVIGTIRSRTHHYPFRLIPPAQLLEYVQQLCESEGVEVAPGVLPLVVRAGGGSARDTLSLLDQLIAGSENNRVEYERAVALLGYTHGALLSEAVDAIGTLDGAAAFDAVDRVIQTGQDPRRFVEDLLERLRDIIVVSATGEQASAVLRGVPADEIEVMRRQAALFGHAELSRVADIVNTALSEMTGATSPRLHLELMVARTLVPSSDDSQRGALARVERLERRIGVDGAVAGQDAAPAGAVAGSGSRPGAAIPPVRETPVASGLPPVRDLPPVREVPGAQTPASPTSAPQVSATPTSAAPTPDARPGAVDAPSGQVEPAADEPVSAADPGGAQSAAPSEHTSPATPAAGSVSAETPEVVAVPQPAAPVATEAPASGGVSAQQLKDAWPEILEAVQKAKRTAWLVVFTAQVRAFDESVLTLAFPSENDVAAFKERTAPGEGVSEYLRQAILDILGVRVMYRAVVDTTLRPTEPEPEPESAGPAPQPAAAPSTRSATSPGPAAEQSAAAPAPGPAPEWSTPGVSSPGGGSSAAPFRSAAPAAARPSTPPPGGPAARPAANPSAPPRASSTAPAPTTSWEVVAIPTSSDDDIPYADEPMPSDEPELPPSLAEVLSAAATSTPEPVASAPAGVSTEPAPAAPAGTERRPGALRFEESTEPGPDEQVAPPSSHSAVAPPSSPPVSSAGGRARYGEAVVREILGANFIEEQPLPGPTA
ncbi:DNA polymerase III subunit gamma and tau [Herbiconiux moechotypicola]|uniref:DNA-directed DNA polymerase n=1 Tax=Herbiconiux moechotypicola TaxID=637393 RepID=A0ABN3DQK6_9MICO|nr:DNA polymerase III subunit gamma and tau [Herbiconiux moechotypicola]MCS5731456.1 DNA polymerase III subunit gamma and tau [Herbiconiux moechotypicola]